MYLCYVDIKDAEWVTIWRRAISDCYTSGPGAVGTHGFHLPSVILHPKEHSFCCSWSKSQGEPSASLAHLHIALGSAMPLEGAYSYGTTICLCSLLSAHWEMNLITQLYVHLWHGCVVQTQSRLDSHIWSFCSLKGHKQ